MYECKAATSHTCKPCNFKSYFLELLNVKFDFLQDFYWGEICVNANCT